MADLKIATDYISEALTKYSPQDAAIAELRDEYMPLTIEGLGDTAGLAKVHAARMRVRGFRVDIEKTRKELKADSLDFGRRVDAEAKRLTAGLAPIEDHLKGQEDEIADEKQQIKDAYEAARQAKIEDRLALASAVAWSPGVSEFEYLSDDDFGVALRAATGRFEVAEAERKLAEAEAAEADRVATEAAEAERRAREEELVRERAAAAAARQKAEEAETKLAAEREAIEAERAEIAEERARVEREAAAEKRAATEAQQRVEAKVDADALRPAREQLVALALSVETADIPAALEEWQADIRIVLSRAAQELRALIPTDSDTGDSATQEVR